MRLYIHVDSLFLEEFYKTC